MDKTEESFPELRFECAHEDLLIQILSHLTIRMKFMYQLVCKEWHDILKGLLRRQKSVQFSYDELKDKSESETAINLDFSHFPAHNIQLFSWCPNVQRIIFLNIEVSDILIWNVSQYCDRVKELTISKRHSMPNNEFKHNCRVISQRFNKLSHLTINDFGITSDQMVMILSSLKQLTHLSVIYLQNISENFAKHINADMKCLTLEMAYDLSIHNDHNSSDYIEFVNSLVSSKANLEILKLKGIPVYTYLVSKLCAFKSLKQLQLELNIISAPTSLVAFGALKCLQCLDLHEKTRTYLLNDEMMFAIMKGCANITKLKLGTNSNLTAISLNSIDKYWPNIQYLLLELKCVRDQNFQSTLNNIDRNTWKAFANLTKLKHFHVTTYSANVNDIEDVLANCAQINEFRVYLTYAKTITQNHANRLIDVLSKIADRVIHINVQNFSNRRITLRTNHLLHNVSVHVRNH